MSFVVSEDDSLHQAVTDAQEYLSACGVEDAGTDAWYLFEFVTGYARADYLAEPGGNMSREQRDAYAALVNRRGSHIPLQYLTGEQEFMGLSFRVNDKVLIPRQDTETLVEAAIEQLSQKKVHSDRKEPFHILEIGTGSGCIAVSLEEFWERKRGHSGADAALPALFITASDLSEEALTVAKENADRLLEPSLRDRIRFFKSDLFDAIPRKKYTMILSNPPYIRTDILPTLAREVCLHEPLTALDGGEDGLYFYRGIISESGDYLEPGGSVMLEIGYDQGDDVGKLLIEYGFLDVNIQKDLSGNDRVASGRLEEKNV